MVDGTNPVASDGRSAKSWPMTFDELVASNAALSGEVRRSHEALEDRAADHRQDEGRTGIPAAHEVRPLQREARASATRTRGWAGRTAGGRAVQPTRGGRRAEVQRDARWRRSARSASPSRDRGCASCLRTCRGAPSFTPRRAHAAARPVALACARSARTSRRCWTTSPAPSTSCATFARSWPAQAASTITQALAPSRPMDRCMAGAGLLTHIAVSKFADHAPLYRLCQIYGRDGVRWPLDHHRHGWARRRVC